MSKSYSLDLHLAKLYDLDIVLSKHVLELPNSVQHANATTHTST